MLRNLSWIRNEVAHEKSCSMNRKRSSKDSPFCSLQQYEVTPQESLGIKSRLKVHFSSDLPQLCAKRTTLGTIGNW